MNLIRYTLTSLLLTVVSLIPGFGQIITSGDTLYGNEWIDYGQAYCKIKIGADGIYRIGADQLLAAGVPLDEIDVANFRLYWIGIEQKLNLSKSSGHFTATDYLEFFGQKNRSEVDRYLFTDPDKQMLNPEYGFTTDTSSFFLTWSDRPSQARYEKISNDLSGNLPAKLPWYLHHEKLVLTNKHFKGYINSQNVRYSTYLQGEGFASPSTNSHNFNFVATEISSTGPDPRLRLKLTGNVNLHQVSLKWNNDLLTNISFLGLTTEGGSKLIDTVLVLDHSSLKPANNFSATTADENNRISFGVLDLTYPRLFRFGQQKNMLITLQNVRDGLYLELEDFNHGDIPPLVYDLNAGTVSQATIEEGVVKIHLPSGPNNRRLAILHPDQIKTASVESPSKFADLTASSAEFIIISNQALFQDAQGKNWVEEYANYRSSTAGGSYQTQIIEIQQLVDQFAFGVEMHPLSVKNFTNYIAGNWRNPQFLFLIGKGLEYSTARQFQEPYEYLPVYGIPGSDNLLTSRAHSSAPLIPVGRLAARTPEQISIYLDKIKVMEDQIANAPQTIEARGWMKRVLHLSAGDGASEQEVILKKMNQMAETIIGQKFGAEMTTVQLQASSDIIDGSVSERTLDLINSGIAVKSYFGHGGINTTQFQSFEDPFFLNNTGRYPIMLALGCFTGNIFTRDISLGESNVLTPSKGGTIYIATSGLGFLSALDLFAKDWYLTWGKEKYGSTMGQTLKAAIELYDANRTISIRTLVQQLVLHGDPAFSIVSKDQTPDLLIDYTTVKTDPESLDGQLDSFIVEFDLVNLGKVSPDSFNITIDHQLPSNRTIELGSYRINLTAGRQKVFIKIPLWKGENVLGTNVLKMLVDANDEITELPDAAEFNNELASKDGRKGYEFVIFDSALRPLIPPKFGITNKADLVLIASSTNPLADVGRYQIQFDTSALFNSPNLISETLENQFAILKWKPPIALKDGVVYYWRVRTIDDNGNQSWMKSSFLFKHDIANGWNQSHYFQFLENNLSLMPLSENRLFSFPARFRDWQLKNLANSNIGTGANGFVNGQRWSDFFLWDIPEGISFVVLDSSHVSGFWKNEQPGQYGSIIKNVSLSASYQFITETPEDRKKIITFLEDIVPKGARVIAYTVQATPDHDLSISEWDSDTLINQKTLFQLFKELGAVSFELLREKPRPYIFEFRNGERPIKEVLAESPTSIAELSVLVPVQTGSGMLVTPSIGPARSWSNLVWSVSGQEIGDSFSVSINNLGPDQKEEIELGEFTDFTLDLNPLLGNKKTFLQITYSAIDEINKTPPQLEYLRVTYEGLPDITFNQEELNVFSEDTLEVGTSEVISHLRLENITGIAMDSILIKYTLTDKNSSKNVFKRYQGLRPFESIQINESHTLDFKGSIEFKAELNPNQDQDELYHFNNFIVKRIEAKSDLTNPVLDVTFDGKRIFNDDIVSPTPLIKISLDDDNENLLIEDSSTFRILITNPNGVTQTITPGSAEVSFTKASSKENIAYLEWHPTFSTDGFYELSVQGRDASGNRSGAIAFAIRFEVVLSSSISSISNYPNPFTISTRFLYTLTGAHTPQKYKITIYNLSGTIVKELTQVDLGPLQAGQNLTHGTWDGTDQYGDRLANGTYLFTFKILDRQEDMKHRASALDNFTQKGFSKLVIVR